MEKAIALFDHRFSSSPLTTKLTRRYSAALHGLNVSGMNIVYCNHTGALYFTLQREVKRGVWEALGDRIEEKPQATAQGFSRCVRRENGAIPIPTAPIL